MSAWGSHVEVELFHPNRLRVSEGAGVAPLTALPCKVTALAESESTPGAQLPPASAFNTCPVVGATALTETD